MYAHVTAWGWFWLTWLTAPVVVEIYWLIVNSANTLSRQWWAVEHLDFMHPLYFSEWTPLHWGMTIVIWLFFAWLSIHLPFAYLR